MKKICIISDIHDWHSNQLKSQLLKKGYDVIKCSFNDINISFNRFSKGFSIKNKNVDLHGVWVRFIGNGTLQEITYKLSVLHFLSDMGIYVHNSAYIIEKTVDKFRTSSILKLNKFNTPDTWVSLDKKRFKKSVQTLLKHNRKVIAKPLFGSQGKGIKVILKKSDIFDFKSADGVFYFQEVVGNINSKIFSDIRVLVSNHKVISCVQRYSKNIVTNVAKGALVKKINITKNLSETCILISKIFNIGYAGIDIKTHKGENFILEINSIPSWKGLQSVDKRNITKLLVKDFLNIIKNKNGKRKKY